MTREEFDNKYESQLTFDNPIQFEQFQLYPVPLKSYFEFLRNMVLESIGGSLV